MNYYSILLIGGLFLHLASAPLNAQNVTIPDAIFKNFLLGESMINTNGDSEIQVAEAAAFTGSMTCAGRNISDLTGIEAFVNLTFLNCGFNQLTNLDVTQNTSLTTLRCYLNQLTNLDVTQNTSLTLLHCDRNQLTSLDVTQNTNLTELNCSQNQITAIDVTNSNTNLIEFDCGQNQLTSLDVAQNTSLTFLNCSGNQITDLDVTQNVSIITLYVGANQLTSLDLSQNTSLEELSPGYNQLSSLDLSQNINLNYLVIQQSSITDLSVKNGNNTNVWFFLVVNTPNLTCIEVDDPIYATSNWSGNIDPTASFSTNCGAITAVNTIHSLNKLKVYPNPTTKDLSLDLGKTYSKAHIQVRNLAGQIILSQQLENTSNTSLELEGAAGIYFVSIQTEEGVTTLKIIKE